MKKTPWFPPEIKPIRVGMYECLACCTNRAYPYHYWNGKEWRYDRNDIVGFAIIGITWRGLARKPK